MPQQKMPASKKTAAGATSAQDLSDDMMYSHVPYNLYFVIFVDFPKKIMQLRKLSYPLAVCILLSGMVST